MSSFMRYIDRPDRYASHCILASFLFWPLALVFVPLGIYQFTKRTARKGGNRPETEPFGVSARFQRAG